MRRIALVPLLLSFLVLVPACGESRLDRSDFQGVYAAAMQAVHDKDLKGLWPLLTPRGRDEVERSLRQWQAWLGDPEKRAWLLERTGERLAGVTEADLEKVRRGSIEDVWVFWLTADPRPARPPQRGVQIAKDGRSVVMAYADPQGALRRVTLVHRPEGWFVERLEL